MLYTDRELKEIFRNLTYYEQYTIHSDTELNEDEEVELIEEDIKENG